MIPIGHTAMIFHGNFSPDGRRVVTAGSFDHTAKVWDVATGDQLLEIRDSGEDLTQACFSPDGTRILTNSLDNWSASIWDAQTGRRIFKLKEHQAFVNAASYSPDGRQIVTSSSDSTAKIWDAATGKGLATAIGHRGIVNGAEFSPDGKTFLTFSGDSTARLWDAASAAPLLILKGHTANLLAAHFSPDGRKLITASDDGTAIVYDAKTGHRLFTLQGHTAPVNAARFSPDGNRIVTAAADRTAILWDGHTGTQLTKTTGHTGGLTDALFSADGKELITAAADSTARIWDVSSGRLLTVLKGHQALIWTLALSPDGSKLLTNSWDYTARVWDLPSGRLAADLTGHARGFSFALFSPDGRRMLTGDHLLNSCRLWDPVNGRLLFQLETPAGPPAIVFRHSYSPDGSAILAAAGNKAYTWDAGSGKIALTLSASEADIVSADFSGDGTLIGTVSQDSSARIWEAATGRLIRTVHFPLAVASMARFSLDFHRILVAYGIRDSARRLPDDIVFMGPHDSAAKQMYTPVHFYCAIRDAATGALIKDFKDQMGEVNTVDCDPALTRIIATTDTAKVWDAATGRLICTLQNGPEAIYWSSAFSPDGRGIITAAPGKLRFWDATTGKLLTGSFPSITSLNFAGFSPEGKKIVTTSNDNICRLWDLASGKMLYSLLAIDKTDYLVLDNDFRYDGSENARKLLYFTCGTEVIKLDQVKEQLWVPDLASRRFSGDSINAPRLADLQICGFTPLVEPGKEDAGNWRFVIHARAGGLGSVVLYVNGNETRRYSPRDLPSPQPGRYELVVPKASLTATLIPGQPNPVAVKAFTAEGDLSSRGATITATSAADTRPPNLYAVMVGISDYKGDALDLRYAAKDANDLSRTLEAAAKKWLGSDHVFMYNLTTEKDRYLLPEKAAIRQTLAAIGSRATANDILLLFFAGHGVMVGERKKQFYLLTADASPSTATGAAVATVGISARELTDWIRPANIRAQKRILILDACNSGQAINDIVHVGERDQQYVAARNDDKGEEVKSIDKLNERSGLFILAASASNQSAYEMGRYGQGLLTYALLKAIKDDPTILENDKYLNIAPWFDHARTTVIRLVSDNGARQEPQIVSTTNFDIGIVDTGVTRNIRLADESMLFTSANFHNKDESVGGDDLDLTGSTNRRLSTIASRGAGPDISYAPVTANPDAWHISGNYTVTGSTIAATVNIWHRKKNLFHFQVTGSRDNLDTVADEIVRNTLAWIKTNNPAE